MSTNLFLHFQLTFEPARFNPFEIWPIEKPWALFMLSGKFWVEPSSNLKPDSTTSSGTITELLWLSSVVNCLKRIFSTVCSSATLSLEPFSNLRFLSTIQSRSPGIDLLFTTTFGISSGLWLTIRLTKATKRSSGVEMSWIGGTPFVSREDEEIRMTCAHRVALSFSFSTSPNSLLHPLHRSRDDVDEGRLASWCEDMTME